MNTRECSKPMRRSRPFRWIEEAEARQVVVTALSEAPASQAPPRPVRGGGLWTGRIRRWTFIAAADPVAGSEAVPIATADTLDE